MIQSNENATVLLFDFDGVIADSRDIYFEMFTTICTEKGFHKLNSREAFSRLMEGNVFRELFKAGFPIHRLKKLAEEYKPRLEAANERIPPYPEMVALLNALAEAYPVYVITANQTEMVSRFLERHGVEGVRAVIGGDLEVSKVKRIRSVMKQYQDHTAFYIGDTKGDMREARRARAVAVGVTWGWHSADKLQEGRPHHLLSEPDELRAMFLSGAGHAHEPPAAGESALAHKVSRMYSSSASIIMGRVQGLKKMKPWLKPSRTKRSASTPASSNSRSRRSG
jgi:phosphoglycolate phosphatase